MKPRISRRIAASVNGSGLALGVLFRLVRAGLAKPRRRIDGLGLFQFVGFEVRQFGRAGLDLGDFGINPAHLANTPVLAPGFGHQGARVSDLRALYGSAAGNVLVSASRSILAAGPSGVAAAIEQQAAEVAEALAA